MAALTDQTTNEPLLNNFIEQHSDNLTPHPSQPNQNDLGSFEEKPNEALRSLFPDDRFWSFANIVGGFVIAVALAVGHHTFLHYLHGRNIEAFPQVWIKGANSGFSNIFSIFVGLSTGSALTQIKWRASGSESLQMSTVDNLFALPAPLGLFKTLMRPRGPLFLPILSSVLIQALVLVSILAPSGLTVAPSELVTRDIEVPIFNLKSQAQFAWAGYDADNGVMEIASLSTFGDKRINSVLLDLPELSWAIPQDCGLKCAFHFEYNAPALECNDVIPGSPLEPGTVYHGTATIYPLDTTISGPPSQQIADAPYDLSINYTNAFHRNTTSSPQAGTYCRFYQAIYNASFELNGNSSTQRASTSVIHRGDYLSWGKTAVVTFNSDNGQREEIASWAICYAFALAFHGTGLIAIMSHFTQGLPVLASIFKIDPSTSSFELGVSNLSQTLVDLFSNLTLGLLSTRGGQDMITANATVWDGSSVWIYTTWILWATYLPAVILAVIVALYGLYTIHLSGIAMDDKFSTFLLATRNAKLSEMCGDAASFEELQRLYIFHQEKGAFVVIDPGLESPN